jgi:signal transduction histidine kinase
LIAGLLAASIAECWSQKASNWRGYRIADGLLEPACVSVSLGAHGRILVRHPNQPFISHLDGYTVTHIPAPEGGAGHMYESPSGQIWTATHRGLLEFHDGEWVLHPVDMIASRYAASPRRPLDLPLCAVRQGMVLCLLPDSLIAYQVRDLSHPRTEVLLSADQMHVGPFTALTLARDGTLWIAGSNGLLHASAPARNLRRDTAWQEYPIPVDRGITGLRSLHEQEDGTFSMFSTVGTEGHYAVVQWERDSERGSWTLHPVPLQGVRFAWLKPNKGMSAVTTHGYFERLGATGDFIETDEISARQFFDAAIEPGGTVWLASSDGLFRYTPPIWQMPVAVRQVSIPIHSLASDRQDRLWFVAGGAMHLLQGDLHREFAVPVLSLRSLHTTPSGSLLLDGGGRLFAFDPDSGVFSDLVSGEGSWRVLGVVREGAVCVSSGVGAKPTALQVYDGGSFRTLAPMPDRDLGDLLAIFSCQNGDLFLSGEEGTAIYHEQKWRAFVPRETAGPEGVTAFLEQPDGRILAAARERTWEFDGREWTEQPRSFDRINTFIRARDGSIWLASNSGCYRFFQNTWFENGPEEGLPGGAVRDLHEDARGRIWAATSYGLSLYHPEADTDPPKASIHELRETEKNLTEGATINLGFSGLDKWKDTPRDRLLYSYRLIPREWSEFFDQTYVTFSDLPAGKHYFHVRAMDRNGNIDPRPARLEFSIVVPWYRESRLLMIAIAGLVVALFFAGLAVNRHWRLLRSYAEVEQKVAERTRQLEVANRELLQSQKMTALGTLAAGIAHDFNNILSIVKGSAQVIEDNLDNPGKVRTRVDRIKTVVDQGAGIVKAMLGFSRESGQQGSCDVNAVVDDTTKLLGDRFLREVHVSVQPAAGLPPLVTSRDLIQQILLNFIFNAAEAMTDRKEIIVTTRLFRELPAEVVLAPEQAQTYVGIAVTDFGCGIPPENLQRIFEPFFTTKAFSARRGTGLGLSMVYELAKKLNAGITVDSVVGRGSTFILLLPVKAQVS